MLKKFIEDEYSICREERQYALYLHNYLKRMISNDFKEENDFKEAEEFKSVLLGNENAVIEHVFYEATFMRDLFEYDKRMAYGYADCKKTKELEPDKEKVKAAQNKKILQKSSPQYEKKNYYGIFEDNKRFNWCLLNFLGETPQIIASEEKMDEIVDYHLGAIGGQEKIEKLIGEKCDSLKSNLRGMMNSKPDIAVIYKTSQESNEKILQFFECKFLSDVDSDDGGTTQLEYQNRIAEFLVKYKFVDESKATKVVRFVRVENKESITTDCKNIRKNKEEYEIQIKYMIEKENALFHIKRENKRDT